MGIERPAVLCYELEAAGLPITLMRSPDGRSIGALLEEPEPEETATARDDRPSLLPALDDLGTFRRRLSARFVGAAMRAGEAASRARALARRSSRRLGAAARRAGEAARRAGEAARRAGTAPVGRPMLASVALVAALAGTAMLIVTNPGWSGHPGARARAQVSRPHGATGQRAPRRAAPAPGRQLAQVPQSATQSLPRRVSPVEAAALEAAGHQQLADGRYPQAIGSLLAAIKASGQSLSGCTEPTTEACLTFAYALYDLGRALRLDGDPGAAVPVLQERLHIDNQRPVVEQELDLARGGRA
jgi:hypothetical protein